MPGWLYYFAAVFHGGFVTIQISELVDNSFESMIIAQRERAGWGYEERHTWGDGGNTMTWSEGLDNYSRRTAKEWVRHLNESAMASGIVLPFLLLLEWLRLGVNPFSEAANV